MLENALPGSGSATGVHVGEAELGLDEVNTIPKASTATQNDVVGQDTPSRPDPQEESTVVTFHVEAPPVGVVDVTTLPLLSTATHSNSDRGSKCTTAH